MKNARFIEEDKRKEEIKICSDCGEHKPRKDFSISCVKKNGTVVRRPYCKKCDIIRQTEKRRAKGIVSRRIETIEKDGKHYYQCSMCKEFKLKEGFPLDRYKFNTIGISRPCKECRKHCNKVSREYDVSNFLSLDQEVEHDKHKGSIDNLKQHMLNLAKNRAKTKGLEFNLSKDDFSIPKKCPILNIDIIPGIGKQSAHSPSLDRINPSKGYTKGNIAVISYRANAMKNDANYLELELFSKNIISYIKMKR